MGNFNAPVSYDDYQLNMFYNHIRPILEEIINSLPENPGRTVHGKECDSIGFINSDFCQAWFFANDVCDLAFERFGLYIIQREERELLYCDGKTTFDNIFYLANREDEIRLAMYEDDDVFSYYDLPNLTEENCRYYFDLND